MFSIPGSSPGHDPARPTPSPGASFAAIDLGTNNCRLLVGIPGRHGFRVIDSYSRLVRLGEGLGDGSQLLPAAMDRALAALHMCAERLSRRRVHTMRAIATEACRRAVNAPEFLARVQSETGIAFEIISPREEAELALEACAPLLTPLAAEGVRRALLLDIGGGSTELAWIRVPSPAERNPAPQLIGTISLPVGVVSVAEYWGGDADGFLAFDETVDVIADRLAAFDAVHRIAQEIRQGGVALLGTSGTVTTLAGVALDLKAYRRPLVDGVVLDSSDALLALARLRSLGRSGLAGHPCVGPERAGFVLPGCAIFAAIHQVWPAPRLVVADRGLREGLLLRMMRTADRSRSGRHDRATLTGAMAAPADIPPSASRHAAEMV